MPQGGRHRDLEGDRGWNEAASSEHEGQALREAPGCRSGQETATEFCSHEQLPSANNQNTPGTGSFPGVSRKEHSSADALILTESPQTPGLTEL